MAAGVNSLRVDALLVGAFEMDRTMISGVFRRAGWRLEQASDRVSAWDLLRHHPFHVVIAEAEVPAWDWKTLLRDLHTLPHPPQLIVTSRHADNYLWSEVLNVGAFDVLPQPLVREETERVIAAARRYYDAPRRLPVRAARPNRMAGLA